MSVPLPPGSRVRVISPSLPSLAFATTRLDRARRELESYGLEVDYGEHAFEISDDGVSAGTPRQRAEDLMAAFADPGVAAVLSAAGGMSSHELLPHLDPALLRANPKPFLGRSDNLAINAFLHAEAGLVSYAGICYLFQLGEVVVPPETRAAFRSVLMSEEPVVFPVSASRTAGGRDWRLPGADDQPLDRSRPGYRRWLRAGRGAGELVGAELAMLPGLIRSGLVRPERRVLWCDVGKPDFDYAERYLTEIADLVDLRQLRGLVVADNPWSDFEEWTGLLDRFLAARCPDATFPVFVGGDCGHYDPTWLLPYGARIQLDADTGLSYRAPDLATMTNEGRDG